MSIPKPNLVWLRTFEAAARLLNFTEAGKELGLTQTAVSLHIKSLEAALGCQLFLRKPRQLDLTDMGHAYVLTVRKALGDIQLATSSLFGAAARQTITIRAPISTATMWLPHLLPEFLDAHPQISIKLVSTIWANSISDEDVDIDIRIGCGDWVGVQVEKISTETIVPIGALGTHQTISTPSQFLDKPLIHILGHEDDWQQFFSVHGLSFDDTRVRYMVDTTVAAFSLVATGGGYATIMTRFANAAIESGHNIEIIGKPVPFSQSHYLTSSFKNTSPRPEVELVKSWIRSCFLVP